MTRVLILGGGPDAEREVSISSASSIHQACLDAGLDAKLKIIDQPTFDEVCGWDTDVVFPALHGRYGEGGALQKLLEQSQHPFVGSRSQASRLAMDKIATKMIAARLSIPTPAAVIFDPCDTAHPDESVCPLEFPVVIKPVADGSSVGLHVCHDESDYLDALKQIGAELDQNPSRVYMIERLVVGREITVSVYEDLSGDLIALPLVEISPAEGIYDYDAKYTRSDTHYSANPDIADGVAGGLNAHALRICIALGVQHLARVDFLLSDDGHWALLEVNTMPGFTPTSLFPMAAIANDMSMSNLCDHLVQCALKERVSSTH
jgi:D-alanine-D-alanine ligase